jgi:glc operon protein GlcG
MNPRLRSSLSVFSVTVLAAAVGHAQTAPAANPLDVVPDKMPFDSPYGAPVGLDRADVVLAAALAEANKHGWKLVCAIIDSGGNLVALKRMDGAQLASIDIAMHKARAAVKFRRETKVFETNVQTGNVYQLTLDDVVASRGGIPLIGEGKLVGAIGCSGGSGSQDEVVAKAGVAAFK